MGVCVFVCAKGCLLFVLFLNYFHYYYAIHFDFILFFFRLNERNFIHLTSKTKSVSNFHPSRELLIVVLCHRQIGLRNNFFHLFGHIETKASLYCVCVCVYFRSSHGIVFLFVRFKFLAETYQKLVFFKC